MRSKILSTLLAPCADKQSITIRQRHKYPLIHNIDDFFVVSLSKFVDKRSIGRQNGLQLRYSNNTELPLEIPNMLIFNI